MLHNLHCTLLYKFHWYGKCTELNVLRIFTIMAYYPELTNILPTKFNKLYSRSKRWRKVAFQKILVATYMAVKYVFNNYY